MNKHLQNLLFFFYVFVFERQRFTMYSIFSFLIRQNSGELVVNVIQLVPSFFFLFHGFHSRDRRSRQWNITEYLINLNK